MRQTITQKQQQQRLTKILISKSQKYFGHSLYLLLIFSFNIKDI
jgi:hypothetical protein